MSASRSSRLRVLLLLLVLVAVGSFLLDRYAPSPTEPPPPPPPPVINGDGVQLSASWRLGTLIVGLESPRDGTGRLFAVEQRGRISVIDGGEPVLTPVLDLTEAVLAGGERGMLGLAFGPDFPTRGHFYVNYTARPDGRTVVSRFTLPAGSNVADPDSEVVILEIPQPYANHNAGGLVFGPDGMLWIATGDGGAGGDPEDRAENPHELLGKMLRLDVASGGDGSADGSTPTDPGSTARYRIPEGNAFDGADGRAEVWAVGLRNPWRYTFDPTTGDLWIADVGQNEWEEINRVPPGAGPGIHFGWDTLEGTHCFEPARGCDRTGRTMPVFEYSHDDGCSVTGGVVYRGTEIPTLDGAYLFSDYCGGWLRALRPVVETVADGSGALGAEITYEVESLFGPTGMHVVAFGQDEAGEVYVVDHTGTLFRLQPR